MKDTKQQSASSISDAAGIQENVAPNRQESTSTQSQGTNQGTAVDSFFDDHSKRCGMEQLLENPTQLQSSIQDQQPQSMEDAHLPKKITLDKLLSLLKQENDKKIVVNGIQYDLEEQIAQTPQPQSFKIFGTQDSNQFTPKPPSTPGSIPSGFNFALIKANILDTPTANKGGFCPSVLPKSFAPQEEFKQLTNSAPPLLFNNLVRPQAPAQAMQQPFVSRLQPPTQFPKHQLTTAPPLSLGTPLPPIFEQPKQSFDVPSTSIVTSQPQQPQINNPQTTSTQTISNSSSTPTMKKHRSEVPTLNDSIVQLNSKFIITNVQRQSLQIQQSESIIKENEELKKLTILLQQEITQLKNTQRVLSTFVVQHFTPKNILAEIKDENILEILSHEQMSNAKLHLSFLFSSPLVKIDEQERIQPLQAIDHLKEFTGVLESLNQTGMQINYQKLPATIDNINMTLNANPIALHFSGHGIRGQLPKQQTLYMQQREFKGYLVVEDQKAQAYYLPDNLLKNILHSQGTRLEFVFVASCHSQFAGNIFHQAGAKHVICVKENFQISDDASICFSKIFYTALFSQSKTVCEAFQIAKRHLQSHEDRDLAKEHEKFMLLKQEEEDDQLEFDPYRHDPTQFGFLQLHKKKHQCRIFGPFKEGKFTNVGNQPLFRVETSKLEDFIGRTLDTHQVISQLLVKRVVTIKGIPGIGKTTLVKAVAHYLDERHQFRDGIIVLSLRNLDQASMFITRLENIICKKIGNTQWKDEFPLEKITSFLKDKEILLILDNAETTSKQDPKNFHEVIQTILDQCPQIKFLFTSRKPIGSFEGHQEQVLELKELNIKYAVDLLKKKAPRPITDEEIKELLKIKPDKVLHSNPLKKPQKVGGSLESHHMFEILKGHPHAISLAAPLLQDKKLKELYYLLNSEEINEWLENQGIKDGAVGSLKVSIDISIKQLSETETRFFWLIGLLPGGCTTQDLNVLWGDGWLNLAEKLLRASLLVKKNIADENIYQLFPFMNTYASTNMNAQEKQIFHSKIVKYYAEICKDLRKEQLEGRLSKLLAIETNIWACIYRIRDQNTIIEQAQHRARSPGLGFYPSATTAGAPSTGSHSSGIIKPLAMSCSSETDQPPQSAAESMNDVSSAAPLNTVVATSTIGFDEQSNRDNQSSKNEYYDEYDSILSQRINGPAKQRSKSEKVVKNMRGGSNIPLTQPQNNEIYETNSQQEEESKICSKNHIEQNEEEQSSFFEMLRNQEFSQQQQQQQQQNTFQSQNHPSDQSFNISSLDNMAHLNRQSSLENSYENFITSQPSNQQNHLNNSFSTFANDQNQTYNRRQQQISFNSQNLNQSFRLEQQQQYMFGNRPFNFNEELSQIHQYQQIRDDTSSVDSLQNYIQNINNQMTSFNNNSLTSQSINDISSYLQSNNMSRRQQKRIQYAGEQEIIPELAKEESVSYAEDDIISQSLLHMRSVDKQEVQEEEEREDLESSDSDKEPKTKQMASSLKVQSSKVFDDEGVIEGKKMSERPESSSDGITNNNYLNETLSGIEFPQVKEPEQPEERKTTNSSLKKSHKNGGTVQDGIAVSKKVTIQENPEQKSSKEQSQQSEKKKKPKNTSATTPRGNLGGTVTGPTLKLEQALNQQMMIKQQHAQSSTVMTPDGSLLVYYITNLLLLTRYEDSLKVIEQFGLKLANDQMCQANLKKLQAYAMHAMQQAMHSNSYKEVKLKYEEALSLFQTLKSVLGQALCSWALGFLLYSHSQQFVTKQVNENKVFELAKRRLEDATQLYNQCKHFAGESQCHRILQFIKQKSKENFLDHIRQAKQLMTTENQLQQRGKSNFILINGSLEGIEESLLLEVIGDHQVTSSRQSIIMMKNKTPQPPPYSELKKKNQPHEETKKYEERPTIGLKSAARQNNKKTAVIQSKLRENNSESDTSMARKAPKKKVSNQDLKESLAKIQEEEVPSTPSPIEENNEQTKIQKNSQKKIESGPIHKDQRLSHNTNSKPSIRRPSLLYGGINISKKGKEDLQNNTSKMSGVKQKVKNDKVFSQEEIKHQDPQVFIQNIESDNSDIFEKASEEMVFTDIDQIFEPSIEINGAHTDLQSRVSMHLNKLSQKRPQPSPQDKPLVINSSNSRNHLKQSASQQNLERSKGIISGSRKSAQPPSTRPQSPKQVQKNVLASSQSSTSIATPKILNKTNTSTVVEPQSQVVSFNITTTTTVKIEGSIPSNTNLTIGPQVTMNGGQLQVPTDKN